MKVLLKRILDLIKPHIGMEILGFILTILYSLSVFASPMVSKYLIDEVIPANSLQKLYVGITIFCLVCLSQPIFGYFKDMLFLNITEDITLNIRNKLFKKVLSAPMNFFDKTNKGEIISRILNDGRGASQFITNFFVIIIKNVAMILMILAGMIYISLKLTCIILLMFLLFALVNWKLSKKFNNLSLNTQQNYDDICTFINQTADTIMTVKSFSMEKDLMEKYNKIMKKAYLDNKKLRALSIFLNNLTSVIVILSLCVIYGLGSILVMKGNMTIGSVIALGLYFQLFVQPVYELFNNNIELNATMPIFDRIYEYIDMDSEVLDGKESKKVESGIIAKNLSFKYGDGTKALNNINLEIQEKGLYALVGRSGSGKSTFIKLLMGLYEPTVGELFIGGKNIMEIDLNTLRKSISLVPQEIDLFNTSVLENIRCGNPKTSEEEIIEMCKKLKLHDKIMSLPEKYNSIITERVNLSGGEKQRIAIARALMKKPKIFICDEPTSALDPENEERIRETIEDISKECTVIVIAHKTHTIINADKIFVFDKGGIVQEGSYQDLKSSDEKHLEFLFNPDALLKKQRKMA